MIIIVIYTLVGSDVRIRTFLLYCLYLLFAQVEGAEGMPRCSVVYVESPYATAADQGGDDHGCADQDDHGGGGGGDGRLANVQ